MDAAQQDKREGLRFLHVELSNFKNIDKKMIDIGGRSFLIIGPNGSGKSSLIQALISPMDAKVIPSKSIQDGEERANVFVKIGGGINGEYKEYMMELYFTPKNQKGRLVIKNDKGETVPSPATFIKSLIGNVSFDIMKWMSMSNEKKIAILKELTGCAKEVDTITLQINEAKKKKSSKGDRADELEAILKNHQYSKEEVEKYSTQIPMQPLLDELSQVSAHLKTYNDIEQKTNNFENSILTSNKAIENLQAESTAIETEIRRLQQKASDVATKIANENAEIVKNRENVSKGKQWLAANVKPNVEVINHKITEATKHNENHNNIGILSTQHRELLTVKQELDKINVDIKKLEDQRSDVIAKSQLPIPGLSFTDDQILINNIPLEEGQHNKSGLFDVSVDVAIALNPRLKTIFLHDASLFDKEHLQAVIKRIEERGYQAICEVVTDDGGLDVKFTETDV